MNLEGKNYKIYFEDCIKGMERLDDESVDLIIADPPFGLDYTGIKGNYNRDPDNVIKGYKEAPLDYMKFSIDWMGHAKRVLKKHGTMYVFSSWNKLWDVLYAVSYLGFTHHSQLTWSRTFPVYKRWNWVDGFYQIFMLLKYKAPRQGKPSHTFNKVFTKNENTGKLRHYPRSDLDFQETYEKGKLKNGTKLPNALVEHLILTSSTVGDTVLDPFLGNGTTAVEALRHKRNFIGFEINTNAREVIENVVRRFC
jgi:site-specific DNA-methyltransferase (adenine-specific)